MSLLGVPVVDAALKQAVRYGAYVGVEGIVRKVVEGKRGTKSKLTAHA